MNSPLMTALVIVVIIDSLVWSVSVLAVLRYALTNNALPIVGGIRLLGGGVFETLGMGSMVVAGIVFVVVSALKILAAYWLWNFKMEGAVLALILLALSALFWYGFALPFGPVGGIIQLVLLGLVWGNLTGP
jgi:hypothetical protein